MRTRASTKPTAKASAAPYLAKTLRGQGELLTNYYAVAQGELANEIALVSGQGPTPQTAANCPDYTEISPGTVGAESQVTGSGCVYPSATLTLPGQLATAGKTWKAYVEGIGNGGAGQPSTCRHPALGSADGNQAPLPGDAYETWRNPFVYFDSLSGSECVQDDVGLEQLQTDLQSASSTPSLSYIVPSACHDGSEKPCEAGAARWHRRRRTVPENRRPRDRSLARLQAGRWPDRDHLRPGAPDRAQCRLELLLRRAAVPEPARRLRPSAGQRPGQVDRRRWSGRAAADLPLHKTRQRRRNEHYNHFSLLHSLEELFGLQPLGYAANAALTGFESGVYNNSPGS